MTQKFARKFSSRLVPRRVLQIPFKKSHEAQDQLRLVWTLRVLQSHGVSAVPVNAPGMATGALKRCVHPRPDAVIGSVGHAGYALDHLGRDYKVLTTVGQVATDAHFVFTDRPVLPNAIV